MSELYFCKRYDQFKRMILSPLMCFVVCPSDVALCSKGDKIYKRYQIRFGTKPWYNSSSIQSPCLVLFQNLNKHSTSTPQVYSHLIPCTSHRISDGITYPPSLHSDNQSITQGLKVKANVSQLLQPDKRFHGPPLQSAVHSQESKIKVDFFFWTAGKKKFNQSIVQGRRNVDITWRFPF